jgi:hypothetical protein
MAESIMQSLFFADMLPLFLKAKGNMTGMVIASSTGAKAQGLLLTFRHNSNQTRGTLMTSESNIISALGQKNILLPKMVWASGLLVVVKVPVVYVKRPDLCIID